MVLVVVGYGVLDGQYVVMKCGWCAILVNKTIWDSAVMAKINPNSRIIGGGVNVCP
jgi:hypothetical protein